MRSLILASHVSCPSSAWQSPCPVSLVPLDVPAGEASCLCQGFGMCPIVIRAGVARASTAGEAARSVTLEAAGRRYVDR